SLYEDVLAHDKSRNDIRKRAADLNIYLGHFDSAIKHLKILCESTPADAENHLSLGECHLRKAMSQPSLAKRGNDGKEGDDNVIMDAQKEFDTAIKLNPTLIEAYVRLTYLQRFFQHDSDSAKTTIEKMVSVNPKSFRAYLERAQYNLAASGGADL